MEKGDKVIKLKFVYFSPTGTTYKIGQEISKEISKELPVENYYTYNITKAEKRRENLSFSSDDLVLIGLPVYAGRLPNVLLPYLKTIKAEGSKAIIFVNYGNRSYDNALVELRDIVKEAGFSLLAAAAFVGEHAFSYKLAAGRPDEDDLAKARDFAGLTLKKLRAFEETGAPYEDFHIKGDLDYEGYYQPLNERGQPFDMRKVQPQTKSRCIDCKKCALACPMGSINYEKVSELKGICIKCGACVKICPVQAKHFTDPDYLFHKRDLEETFQERKEAEFFL